MHALHLIISACAVASVIGVDRNNFKTCSESSFCKRNRDLEPKDSRFHVVPGTINIGSDRVTFELLNDEASFVGEVITLVDNTARLMINEKAPLHPRYVVKDSLDGEPKTAPLKLEEQTDASVRVNFGSEGRASAVIVFKPFRVDFLMDKEIVTSLNSRGLMNFEHYRKPALVQHDPPAPTEATEEHHEGEEGQENHEQPPAEEHQAPPEPTYEDWTETYKSHTDHRPKGPSSLGMDISFPGVEHVYGIPEHADSLALKLTKGNGAHHSEPYRLYNLDVFEYELNNPMALYGSIPVMMAHNAQHSTSVFWNNAAETWIDVSNSLAKSGILSMLSYFHGSDETPQIDTHWFSESGIIDVFVMLGPKPHDLFRQYAALTGPTPLPPMFSIAYHQCRWNYNDQEDVYGVNKGYEDHDIPVDVIWLDIEHTDGKKYFTWDVAKFPNSKEMLDKLWSYGRRMVTIVDPHIKREDGYHIHSDASSQGLYIKNHNGGDYDGWCWPGSSSWIDFTSPDIRKWWAEQLSLSRYSGSTTSLFTWNDMNEPSVFNGPEITMHKDAKHHGDWEHRDVHNVYGMLQPQATGEGQVARSGGRDRPFVLSRAFFAGSQRFGAIWTGDNTADWGHLKASMPMLLSIGLTGLTFAGADVGGFFKNPDSELLIRWYQAGAHQPFFRAHAHLDTKRREPYLHDENVMQRIRNAILARYSRLPFWYTLYYHASKTGVPTMRPLWVEFPSEEATFSLEEEYLIGSALLAKPVTEAGVSSWDVYLPGKDEVWYATDDLSRYTGGQTITLSVTLDRIPLFQRGGSIIPTKERIRRSTVQMLNDPLTLTVALNNQGSAKGDLYMDDETTFDHRSGKYLLRNFEFTAGKFTSRNGDTAGSYRSESWVQRIDVIGITAQPATVTLTLSNGSQRQLAFYFNASHSRLVIRKPDVNIGEDFDIVIA
eukprot:scpid32873/ scgid16435/ Neutral alpha-glucosidase AB; Alpha-glucosidase 2; Glucosidase II subunit alpha